MKKKQLCDICVYLKSSVKTQIYVLFIWNMHFHTNTFFQHFQCWIFITLMLFHTYLVIDWHIFVSDYTSTYFKFCTYYTFINISIQIRYNWNIFWYRLILLNKISCVDIFQHFQHCEVRTSWTFWRRRPGVAFARNCFQFNF